MFKIPRASGRKQVRRVTQSDQWLPLTEAARQIGISAAKLSRMAKEGRVNTQKDPYDERLVLVNMEELRRMFPPRGGRR